MRTLFADTANLESIKKLNEMGLIAGVTTNPSIISKEPKQNYNNLIKDLWLYCYENSLTFSVEVFCTDLEEIKKQSIELVNNLEKIAPTRDFLYIKIPIGKEEIKAISYLSKNNLNINCTCCYTEQQLELAAISGAKYVSLFYNRARDIGINVNQTLERTSNFIKNNNLTTKIIAGSIRKPEDVTEAWNYGANIVTCSPSIIENCLYNEKTIESINNFMKDFSSWFLNE